MWTVNSIKNVKQNKRVAQFFKINQQRLKIFTHTPLDEMNL